MDKTQSPDSAQLVGGPASGIWAGTSCRSCQASGRRRQSLSTADGAEDPQFSITESIQSFLITSPFRHDHLLRSGTSSFQLASDIEVSTPQSHLLATSAAEALNRAHPNDVEAGDRRSGKPRYKHARPLNGWAKGSSWSAYPVAVTSSRRNSSISTSVPTAPIPVPPSAGPHRCGSGSLLTVIGTFCSSAGARSSALAPQTGTGQSARRGVHRVCQRCGHVLHDDRLGLTIEHENSALRGSRSPTRSSPRRCLSMTADPASITGTSILPIAPPRRSDPPTNIGADCR